MVAGWGTLFTRTFLSLSDYWQGGMGVPAVADGALDQYEMCDWIDNACAIEVIQRITTYGHLRVPMRVRATSITREASRVP